MKHIVIGDVHGYWQNLRQFLLELEVINEDNEPINRDQYKVYCSGDLIDGGTQRHGDLILLEYAEKWFDQVALGNHEYAFIGGPRFMGLRQHDFEIQHGILSLLEKGVYTPSINIENNWLVVHAGLSSHWRWGSVGTAHAFIQKEWNLARYEYGDISLFDWIGELRAGKFSDDVGGIFWLDWEEPRNMLINQIVGHSTYYDGPIRRVNYPRETYHWNVDVGGKMGSCLGGVIVDGNEAKPIFWGERYIIKNRPSGMIVSDEEGELGDITFEVDDDTGTYGGWQVEADEAHDIDFDRMMRENASSI